MRFQGQESWIQSTRTALWAKLLQAYWVLESIWPVKIGYYEASHRGPLNCQTSSALLKSCTPTVPITTSSVELFIELASTLLGLGMSVLTDNPRQLKLLLSHDRVLPPLGREGERKREREGGRRLLTKYISFIQQLRTWWEDGDDYVSEAFITACSSSLK